MLGVILAGGSGHRLWPRSRRQAPKQFNDLLGQGESLFQMTARRLAPLIPPAHMWVVTNDMTAHLAQMQLPEIPAAQILCEPVGRNTAPAIAWFMAQAEPLPPEQVVAVLPSDHWVQDSAVLCRALMAAAHLAQAGWLVLLGVQPDRPHTGYGYIQVGAPIPTDGEPQAFTLRRFQEKPSLATAQALLDAGGHLWNSGIFVGRVDRLRQAFREFVPGLLDTAAQPGPAGELWAHVPAVSLDHAIMEKVQHAAVVPLETGWTDLGSWDALEHIMAKDAAANVVMGDNVIALDSAHNIICANGRLVAILGVEDLVIVDTPDALLVGRKNHMQSVKAIISELKSSGHNGVT